MPILHRLIPLLTLAAPALAAADGSAIVVHTLPDTYCDAEEDLRKGCAGGAGGAREACRVTKAQP